MHWFKFLKPPVAAAPVPEIQHDETYQNLRLQEFICIFLGYEGYSLFRQIF
ncbi:glycerol-3-phosphate transporter, partial [Staphylococcus pseudintermedius]